MLCSEHMGVAMSERDIVAELDQRIGSLGGNLGPGEVVVFDADAIEMLQRARDEIVALRAIIRVREQVSEEWTDPKTGRSYRWNRNAGRWQAIRALKDTHHG